MQHSTMQRTEEYLKKQFAQGNRQPDIQNNVRLMKATLKVCEQTEISLPEAQPSHTILTDDLISVIIFVLLPHQ